MTASALQNRLRPGRDANDTSWLIQRYRRDWQTGQSHDVTFDMRADALTLAPQARPAIVGDWLPLGAVTGPDGAVYRADPERDVILREGACDDDFAPLSGIGGSGLATGRLRTPTGLAFDALGRLYVADSGNGRVQVLDIASREIVAVLTGDLVQPVHVAIATNGEVFVADVGTGRVHVFGPAMVPCGQFELTTRDPWTGILWVVPPNPRPLAITILDSGALAVFDPTRPLLWHMTCDGQPLEALPWPVAGQEPPGWAPTPARFAASGEMIVGPLDSGTHDLAWHRVLIDGDMPDGTRVCVQTFAANAPDPGAVNWAPRRPLPIPTAQADRAAGDFDRLVLANDDLWQLANAGRLTRATPPVHRFDGDGPVAVSTLDMPAEVAPQVQAGDRIRLTTDAGGQADYGVVSCADHAATMAANGPQSAFDTPESIRLVTRDGIMPPYGTVDITRWAAGIATGVLTRDGQAEPAVLPHLLAAILAPGDVMEFTGADGTARIEIIELSDAPVTITLDQPVEGDFSVATVSVLDTVGRLVVREPVADVAHLPPGNTITVIDDVRSEQYHIAFVDGTRQTIWLAAPMTGDMTDASWTNAEVAPPAATDNGRYLWVRLVLTGKPLASRDGVGPAVLATATPMIRALRVTGPRPSLLAWMPAIFSTPDPRHDPPGALFLERFLALFEGQFTRIEDAYDSVSRLLNPRASDADWLDFLAAWMDFAFDPSWPLERRRMLIIEGADLQAAAGTPRALVRYLEIYTGAPAAITEGFRDRPPPSMQLGARGALGIAPLGQTAGADRFAHRFTVRVTLPPGRDRDATLSAIHKIVETMKPAQTRYRLDTGDGLGARIGMDTSVGGIFIPGPDIKDPCLCDPLAAPGTRGQTGQVRGGFRLGGHLGRGSVSEVSFQGDRP
jgi:phage tail-like protein